MKASVCKKTGVFYFKLEFNGIIETLMFNRNERI